jgi:uncharacterized protein YyaL (SSP411 family)
VTPGSRHQAEPLLEQLRKRFVPNSILVVTSGQAAMATGARLFPLLENKTSLKGKPTAYVCKKRVCKLPTSDPELFARQISEVEPLSLE